LLPFALFFLVAGIVLLVAGRKVERDATRAARWPTVTGTLVRCEVIEKPAIRSEDLSHWDLAVEYSYVVHGVTYRGTRYGFGYGGGLDEGKYRADAEALQRQPQLRVHHDPAHPAESVLDTTVQTSLLSLAHTGRVMAVVSAVIAVARC
jgi:hypothetical protein